MHEFLSLDKIIPTAKKLTKEIPNYKINLTTNIIKVDSKVLSKNIEEEWK